MACQSAVPVTNFKTKIARSIERPRPLLQHSVSMGSAGLKRASSMTAVQSTEACLDLLDSVIQNLKQERWGAAATQDDIVTLNASLKLFGGQIEVLYRDQLNAAMLIIRNWCKDERLDLISRLYFLEMIELRAMEWKMDESVAKYYKQKLAHLEMRASLDSRTSNGALKKPGGGLKADRSLSLNANAPEYNPSPFKGQPPPPPLLMNSSGLTTTTKDPAKILSPTSKMSCKDEVVIRNADSGREYLNGIELESKVAGSGKYNHTVRIGTEKIRISGESLELVQAAKIVLDDFFASNPKTLEEDPSNFQRNNANEVGKKLSMSVGVLRQPLYPSASKEAFSDATDSEAMGRRRTQFAQTSAEKMIKERIEDKEMSSYVEESQSEGLVYSRDELLRLADVPLSQIKPFNWNDIVSENPSMERKVGSPPTTLPRDWTKTFSPDGSSPLVPPPPFPTNKKVPGLVPRKNFLEVLRPDAPIRVWDNDLGEWVEVQSDAKFAREPTRWLQFIHCCGTNQSALSARGWTYSYSIQFLPGGTPTTSAIIVK
eukprot:maker-scaffold1460_size40381-snap-gene-0.10 protein:Tk04334 transcript:maker-scaffold1460_size40381-snap-gene-0.10-mRNA-1 annotation:"PREDICTED: uncharacterized protein LOC409396 isoform X5"